MSSTYIRTFASSLLVLLAAAGCGGQSANESTATTPTAAASASAAPDTSATPVTSATPEASATPSKAGAEPGAHKEAAPHWGYSGEGDPAHWGDLSPDYALCKTGASQTPIDIPKGAAKNAKLEVPVTSYKAFPLKITNNGHTLQVVADPGSSVKVGADEYEVKQFHFHSPSEHTIAGKSFDMEMHIVHQKAGSDKLLVIGLLFNKGKESDLLAPIWANAPGEVTKEPKVVAGTNVDLAKFFPAKPSYYHYSGSLTTPPCSEGVEWFVMTTQSTASEAQIKKMGELFHGPTNRPVQPLGARKVEQK